MPRAHLLLVLLLLSFSCFANESHKGIQYHYYLDTVGDVTVEDADKLAQSKWLVAEKGIVSYDLLDSDYLSGALGAHLWVKVILPEETRLDRIWLELLPNVGLNGTLATQHKGEWQWHRPVGVKETPFEEMPARYLTFIVDTSIDKKVAYLKLSTDQIFHFQLQARTLDALPKYFIEQSVFVGFIFGILILAIVYNGAIGLVAKEPSFIYYAIYELSLVYYLACVSGYLNVFTNNGPLGGTPGNFGVIICVFTAFFFVRSLLDTKIMQPRYDRFMRMATALVGICAISVLVLPNHLSYALTEAIGLSSPALVLFAGYKAYKLGHPLACYFLAAWTLFLCFAATWAWMWLGFIEPSEFMLDALLAVTALEALLLSLILGVRFGHLKRTSEDQVMAISAFQTLSETDELTNLFNRRGLMNQIQILIDEETPFVWSAVDIDHFKKFNDAHGHLAGDKLLKKLGKLLKFKGRRADDTDDLNYKQFAGRVGGEEFAIILPNVGLEEAEQYLNNLSNSFNNTKVMLSSGDRVGTTLSIGATEYQPGEDVETTWKRADKLLYEAKNAGRNTRILRNLAV